MVHKFTWLCRLGSTLGLILFFTPSSYATLGGSEDSIDRDLKSLGATDLTKEVKAAATASASPAAYKIRAFKFSGTVVKEYIDNKGMVFAVSWQGLKNPDLKTLFGDEYPEYAKLTQNPKPPNPRVLVL